MSTPKKSPTKDKAASKPKTEYIVVHIPKETETERERECCQVYVEPHHHFVPHCKTLDIKLYIESKDFFVPQRKTLDLQVCVEPVPFL